MLSKFLSLAAVLALSSVAAPTANCSGKYEYVVVGSGPGGGTLAANLARAGHSVFLIEAGGDHGDELAQEVPSWWVGNNANPEMAWSFWVEHYKNETQARRDNKYAYQYPNGSIYYGLDPPEGVTPLGILYPRGSTVGGSSQTNAMNFVLPPDNDWQAIADLTGDDSWTAENMREHFVAFERNGYVEEGASGHGFDGYIGNRHNDLKYVTERDGISAIAREGLRLAEGLTPETDEEFIELLQRDANSDDPDRWASSGRYLQFPVHVNKDGTRSGARNYVADTLAAKNADGSPMYPLTLSTNSLAIRVLLDETEEIPKAYGVEYLKGVGLYAADSRYDESDQGEKMTVTASREVIVSGGAFNTPQILKLSGIGPREELERFDIPVVVDLPAVGKHLQDHYESGMVLQAQTPWPNNPFEGCSFGATTDPEQDPCLREWIEDSGSSAYSQAGTPISMAYRSSVANTPDVDLYFFASPDAEFRGFYPGFAESVPPPGLFGWSVVKAHGRSETGTVELRSSNPRDTPIINFNFFEEGGDLDLQAMQEGVELVLEIMNAAGEPFTPYNISQPIPGLDIKQSIADTVFSHHASCSCRMGPKGDGEYCVDSEFRVNGVNGLRVVDGSVFPHVPGGFPVAATFMISRKAFNTIVSGLED